MTQSVLLVEDNAEMRENIRELLHLAGYNVSTANNGKEGLEAAHRLHPDLILCDIMMPELDGYGMLRALSNAQDVSSTPFVFLTAKAEKEDFRKGMDLGADDYLTKPFEGDELLRVVEARLRKNNMIRKKFENTLEGLNDFMKEVNSLDELASLSEQRTVKKFMPKQMVYMEGDSANFLYFIISGKIKTFKTNEWGKDYITEIHSAGEFFGHTALLDENGSSRQSAMVIDPAEVALIPKQDFYRLLYSNNEISIKFIRFISNNMAEAEERLLRLAYDTARKRVAEALLFMMNKYNPDGKSDSYFPVHREDISSIAGIAPESVSRNLSDFREEGLIETQGGKIRIPDRAKLEKMKW